MSDRLLVLGWHNVRGTWCFPSRPGAGPRGLAHQLSFLRHVANVVPLASALEKLHGDERLPPRAVALTFDDGYADVLELAVPLLQRLQLPATFFLVPGFLSGTVTAWWERLGWAFSTTRRTAISWEDDRLDLRSATARRRSFGQVSAIVKRRDRAARYRAVEEVVCLLDPGGEPPSTCQFLDWAGARELAAKGFDIGSHSESHSILAQETAAEQERDLRSARQALQKLGSIDLVAYPNGTRDDYNAASQQAARLAGHSFALTTIDGFNRAATPNLEIRRSVIYPERSVLDLARNLSYAWRGTPDPDPSRGS